ncbi:MAG: hypothetical protein LBB84_08000 [Tannerellaceae bacterium]|jgi:hypothetical protein|nr:hypothetical protein [Tannerellaceae bacterium]
MINDRIELYKRIESERNSKLIVYVTGTRQGLETQIGEDILPLFTEHLDKIGDVDKISLYLYTNGGHTSVAWSLVNLIRSFCKKFEIIIPEKCFSTGTLICLGADSIVMTKQASLGPIDPSVNGPLNPAIPGIPDPNVKVPVSVEHVNAYIEMAKNELGIRDKHLLTDIFLKLSEMIHPITLGQVYKSKAQIKMFAKNLLKLHDFDGKEDDVVKFLCSESGSHDYSIRRKEASALRLPIEKPNDNLYRIIKATFDDISKELELNTPYQPVIMVANRQSCPYKFRRGLIESIHNGTDVYSSDGEIIKHPDGKITDNRLREGWVHEGLTN